MTVPLIRLKKLKRYIILSSSYNIKQYIKHSSCFVVRRYELFTHCKLSNMKSKILPNCLKGKYGYHLGKFSNTSFVVFGAEEADLQYE